MSEKLKEVFEVWWEEYGVNRPELQEGHKGIVDMREAVETGYELAISFDTASTPTASKSMQKRINVLNGGRPELDPCNDKDYDKIEEGWDKLRGKPEVDCGEDLANTMTQTIADIIGHTFDGPRVENYINSEIQQLQAQLTANQESYNEKLGDCYKKIEGYQKVNGRMQGHLVEKTKECDKLQRIIEGMMENGAEELVKRKVEQLLQENQ